MEIEDLSRMLGRDRLTVSVTLNALKNKQICDIKLTPNSGNIYVLIISRRMVKEAKKLNKGKFRQRRHRESKATLSNAVCNADITPKKIEDRSKKIEERKKRDISPTGFDDFYQAYPRKAGRHAAELAWAKINPTPDLKARIIASVQAWAKTDQWKDSQYIPHPATYLNQKRWEDEIPTSKDESYEMLKAKAREHEERVQRILSGTGVRNGVREVVRPSRPQPVEREEADLDTGIDFESLADESDPSGH